jgi:hypothetical protein
VTILKEGKSESWQEGYDAGFAGLTDSDRVRSDLEYMEGAVTGALAYDMFIMSEEDHDGQFVQDMLATSSVLVISLSSLKESGPGFRHSVPAVLLKQSHIPLGCPDLSDLEGTTDREDRHCIH